MKPLVERYTNKRVAFRFSGASVQIDLSQALFSSFDIDSGTKFLLGVAGKQIELEKTERIADVGCGTGAIGIALLKANGLASCVFQDRDALALEFAQSNCDVNGVSARSRFAGGLGMQPVDGEFDLILSNLPAKAGLPVLAELSSEISWRLKPGGVGAVVIVSPLADALGEMLSGCGAKVFHTEDRKSHRVYLFRPNTARANGALFERIAGKLDPYIRGRKRFSHGGISYELDTVYNLPDFDTLGRETVLAMDLIDKRLDRAFVRNASGKVLIWNPGQGHLAVYLLRRFPDLQPDRLILASRDALSLEISRRNISLMAPATGDSAAVLHIPALERAVSLKTTTAPAQPGEPWPEDAVVRDGGGAQVSLELLLPHPVPGVHWEEEAALTLSRSLEPGGAAIASAASTEIHRFLGAIHGLVLHDSRKYRGSRAVVLRKSP